MSHVDGGPKPPKYWARPVDLEAAALPENAMQEFAQPSHGDPGANGAACIDALKSR